MAARSWLGFQLPRRRFSAKPFYSTCYSTTTSNSPKLQQEIGIEDDGVPSSGISRPLSYILKDLNKKVPESLLRLRSEPAGGKYIPWYARDHIGFVPITEQDLISMVCNFFQLVVEWSGEVRSITYSADGKSVSVVYRVTLYGTDAEIFGESTGTAPISDLGCGNPVHKAEAMAFRRACARFGLGLHLYHEDLE